MAQYCPECGGALGYDSLQKTYICKSCGLTSTFQDIINAKDMTYDSQVSSEEEKRRRHKEYLKWWLSRK